MLRKMYEKISGVKISREVPDFLLFKFFAGKFCDLLRGFVLTGKFFVFVGAHSKICSRKKIQFGKWNVVSHDCFIDGLSAIGGGAIFGDKCSVGSFTRIECTGSLGFLGKGFRCGNGCGLGVNCFYGAAGGIEMGDNVIVGNFVTMHSENHNFSDLHVPIKNQGVNHKGIKIGSDCWIGAKATILDGAEIGNGVVVAAGAVVAAGKYPDNVVIGGVPAKIIKRRTE